MFSEKQLVKQCIKQNRQAQKQLFEQYSVLFINICKKYAFETSEAKDILQEGFLKIFQKINQYRGTAPLKAWMAVIIFNTAITSYNRNKKRYHFHYDIGKMSEEDAELTCDDFDFTYDELSAVMDSLPQGYRKIFYLYAAQGFNHKEIAELMKIEVSTSRSQYLRARRLIKKKLENLNKIRIPKEEDKKLSIRQFKVYLQASNY